MGRSTDAITQSCTVGGSDPLIIKAVMQLLTSLPLADTWTHSTVVFSVFECVLASVWMLVSL